MDMDEKTEFVAPTEDLKPVAEMRVRSLDLPSDPVCRAACHIGGTLHLMHCLFGRGDFANRFGTRSKASVSAGHAVAGETASSP